MNHICRILLLILPMASMCHHRADAQTDDNETRREINEIKRSPDYFYAESTHPDENTAREAANVLLATYINDYIKEHGITGARRAEPDNLECLQYLTMMRGTNTRVFAYLPRAIYIPGYTSPATPSGKQSDLSVQSDQSVKSDSSDKPDKSDIPDKSDLYPAARNAINELMGKGTLQEAVRHLAYLQSCNIVKRYGTIRDCRNTAGSLWIIADNDPAMTIKTILGPGADTRTNYATGETDSLANHSGCNAVWFEFH